MRGANSIEMRDRETECEAVRQAEAEAEAGRRRRIASRATASTNRQIDGGKRGAGSEFFTITKKNMYMLQRGCQGESSKLRNINKWFSLTWRP